MSGNSGLPSRFRDESRCGLKIKRNKMAKTSRREVKSPSAWIVAPKDRGRKSVKFDTQSDYKTKGTVYLTNGEEFQIELYNPMTQCVLADIKLNGNSISESGLVLRPGERFYLDCFIDDKKKFVFSTYEVEDTQESHDAISKNGLLEVFFYKETATSIRNWSSKLRDLTIVRHYHHYPYWSTTLNPLWINTPNVYCGTSVGTGGLGYVTTENTNGVAFYGTSTAYHSNSNTTTTGSFNLSNVIGTSNTSSPIPIGNNIETGRVEKGDKSEQKFESVDIDFDSFYISSTILELLPESRKPIEAKDLKKEKKAETKLDFVDDAISLIKKLAELHEAGILTDQEFSEKKAELLGRI